MPQNRPSPGPKDPAWRGFESLKCDAVTGVLTGTTEAGATEAVAIGARGARILSLLLARRGQVVPLAELMAAGWGGYVVEESNLSVEIASLRNALHRVSGDLTGIAALPRHGYMLAPGGPGLKMPGRWETPAIGVLRMRPATAALECWADELTRRVTGTLALHAGLSITPAHVAALAIGPDALPAADLGLRYLLHSTLDGSAGDWRVTLTLTDAANGQTLWEQHHDDRQPLTADRQDRLAAELVQALDVLLVRGEEARIGYQPTRNLAAWSHYIRGLGHAYWPRHGMVWTREVQLALQEWEQALALDPDSAALLATVGAGHAVLAAYPLMTGAARAATEAHRHLEAALDRDPDHPIALAFFSMMLSELERFEVAVEVSRRAIRLAPHAPAVTAVAAVALCAAGLAEEAVAAVEVTLASTPHFPSIYSPPLARAWRNAGRVAESIRFLEALNNEPHKFDGRELILAYMQAGRHEDAVNAATQLLLLEPGFTVSGWLASQHRVDARAIAQDVAALRAVGLPE